MMSNLDTLLLKVETPRAIVKYRIQEGIRNLGFAEDSISAGTWVGMIY